MVIKLEYCDIIDIISVVTVSTPNYLPHIGYVVMLVRCTIVHRS